MSVNEKMTALADETRELVGSNEKMGLDEITTSLEAANGAVSSQANLIIQIIEKVNNLPEAGGNGGSNLVLQHKDITKNGYYTADDGYDGFDSIRVQVSEPSSDMKLFIEGVLTELYNDQATYVMDNAFDNTTNLEKIILPNVKHIGHHAFDGCNSLY